MEQPGKDRPPAEGRTYVEKGHPVLIVLDRGLHYGTLVILAPVNILDAIIFHPFGKRSAK